MQARNSKERILALKQWRIANGKTVEQCIELCGTFPSDTTMNRIFGKGGEDKSFRESTIAAVELALLGKVYEPSITIPVEDVIRAQEDTASRFSAENRALLYQVKRQSHIINTLILLVVCCIVFFGGVALYDFLTHCTGFWNTSSYPVWIAKVAFLICVAAALLKLYISMNKLKAQFNSEED